MRFGFLVTARCNATCTHCTVNSGPYQSTALPGGKVMALMDEAAALWRRERRQGEHLQFSISGGEPFLDFAKLVEIVRHGSGLGATVTCVSNGYWASSDDQAQSKLKSLRDAGLFMLAISASRFHQAFVKRERVERALAVARKLGIGTALKCVITGSDQDGWEQWARSQPVDKLEVFPVMPYLREGATLPDGDYIRDSRLPRGRCPAATLTVREDGRAYTCCMPGAFNEFLSLGNVFEASLAQINERFYLQGKQQVLRHRGPIHFARAVISRGGARWLRDSYEGVCDLCAHITTDPRMAAIATEAAEKFAKQELRRALQRSDARPTTQKRIAKSSRGDAPREAA